MPYNRKTTGMPNVDRVVNDIYSILDRFKPAVVVGGESGEPVSWFDIINKPIVFPPESHTQNISTINNLQTTLDNKEPFIALGTGNKYLFRDKTWKEIDWSEIVNKPSTYSPTSHIHAIADITSLQDTLDSKQPLNSKLTAISGLAVTSGNFIASNGTSFISRKLQNSDLPAIAITDTFVVNSQAAMLALSTAERGDVAVRTDLNKSFILKGNNPAVLLDWQELLTPTDAVLSVDGRTGVVSLSDKYQPLDTDLTTIAGLTHSNRHVMVSNGSSWTRRALEEADLPSLSISKITNLQANLDGKLDNRGVGITSFDDTGPNTNRGITIFSSGFNKPDQPSGANYWSGFEFRHNIVEDYRSQIAMGTTGITPQLAIRNKTNGVWGSWHKVLHEGNFDINSKLDVNHVSNNVHNYRSVYTIRFTGVTHNTTGTLKINLPSSWNNVRYRFEMRGYAYSNNINTYGSWRYVGSGFAYSPDSRWYLQGGQFLEGNPSFNQVRYTHDGSRCCILLGDTTTTWTDYTTFPVLIDIDVITDAPISRDGWSFEVLTSEDGYAWGNIQSTKTSIYGNSATIPNTALIGKTTATGGYRLEVEGNALVNGNSFLKGYLAFAGTNKWITSNTATTDKNSSVALGYPNTANSGYVVAHEINHATRPGDVVLQAGGSNGAISMSPRAYFGTRPENNHWWNLALDQYNTLYATDVGTNIMHNLYYDGADWRYRYGSGSNSGGIITTLAYNQFSVQVADNGTADQVATLTPAIRTNLSGNTAFGKSTFVGGYKVEVAGNALVEGNSETKGHSLFKNFTEHWEDVHLHEGIQLLNKAGNGWLDFLTSNTSGTETVADLSNVGSITPAGTALKVNGDVFLWNKLQMINRAGTAWDVIDRETGSNGIGARLKSIVKLNDMNVADGGFSRNGNISIGGNRVVMSRRNAGTAATINITTNPQIIDLNSYAGISRFDITTSRADAPIVYFKNATEGDEIFVKIVEAGQYASEYAILLGWNIDPHDGTWMNYATKRYFHLICEGDATASGVTANKWWIAGVHGLYSP